MAAQKTQTEDLSRYTVGPEGKAPAQNPNEANKKEGSQGPDKKKQLTGFGLRPRDKKISGKVPLEQINARLYLVGIIISLIILIVTGVAIYVRLIQKPVGQEVAIEQETTDIQEVTPQMEALPREEISLEVLNGSGVVGEAGRIADIFEELGYEIGQIDNADPAAGNQLFVNPDFDKEALEFLFEDVLVELEIEESTGDLTDSDASARIILGN